ncbi:Protein LIPS-17 [Aphelenchoides avenae]|nr:Protein LIPS-17 [Aphelenchus avenae]
MALVRRILLFVLVAFASTDATISESFRKFIRNRFGIATEQLTSRDDLGWVGSFGGGNHVGGRRTKRNPVIYIHGSRMTAGEMTPVLDYYLQHGYAESEVYATTYSVGGLQDQPDTSMKCVFAKEIRVFVQAVAAYTNSSSMRIVAYSRGSAATRKAILGGKCVETDETLGEPLTNLIELYLAVAGVNHGHQACDLPWMSRGPACSPVNGCTCTSQYFVDINSREHYEARTVVTLRSTEDEVVNNACFLVTAEIAGSNTSIVLNGYSHHGVMFDTAPLQYKIVTAGKA